MLQKMNTFDQIINETKITSTYGSEYVGVDCLAIKNDYIITIQNKWEKTSPKIERVIQFVNISEKLKELTGRQLLCALFVSKCKMTRNGIKTIKNANNDGKYSFDVYFNLDNEGEENMSKMMGTIKNFIIKMMKKKGFIKNDVKIVKTLRDDQRDNVDKFVNKLLVKQNLQVGIIMKPTGTGKTIEAIACIGKFMEKYPLLSILWITERIDVLKSQFDNSDKIDMCIEMGLIGDYSKYNFVTWYKDKSNIEDLNKLLDKDKPTILITNTASLLWGEKYKNITKDKFGKIVVDECHWMGAQQRYHFLKYTKQEWTNLKILLGFSATPIRPEKENIARVKEIFGDGQNVFFISTMTFLEAVHEKLILPPDFYWIETKLDKEISYSDFKKNVNIDKYNQILEHINVLLGKSVTQKGLFWSQTTNNADNWKKIFEEAVQNKTLYPNISKFKFFITHSNMKNNADNDDNDDDTITKSELDQFMIYEGPAVLIAVEQAKEGFDDERIDIVGNLEPVKERSVIKAQQQTGRPIRTSSKYKLKKKAIVFDCFCFDNEEDKIKKIISMLAYNTLLLKNVEMLDEKYDANNAYDQVAKMIKQNPDGTITLKVNEGIEIPFNILSSELKQLEWNNIPEKIKEELQKQLYQGGITCKKAIEIIKKYNIETEQQYQKICENDSRLPKNPFNTYPDFPGWTTYLSVDRSKYYNNYNDCKKSISEIIKNDQSIKSNNVTKIYELCKEIDNKLPPNPCDFYKDYGITDISKLIEISIIKKQLIMF